MRSLDLPTLSDPIRRSKASIPSYVRARRLEGVDKRGWFEIDLPNVMMERSPSSAFVERSKTHAGRDLDSTAFHVELDERGRLDFPSSYEEAVKRDLEIRRMSDARSSLERRSLFSVRPLAFSPLLLTDLD